MPEILIAMSPTMKAALDAAIDQALLNMQRPEFWEQIEEHAMKKAELEKTVEDAHTLLDELGVARGDAFGAWPLTRRIQECAETVTPERADMARAAHRRLHGEE